MLLPLLKDQKDDLRIDPQPPDSLEPSKTPSESTPQGSRNWADEQLNPYNGFPSYGEFDHYSY